MSGRDLIDSFAEIVTVTRYGESRQVKVLEFDADFIDGNIINMKIDGFSIVAVTFDTDHSTTLSNLAIVIEAMGTVQSAETTGARAITITAQDEGNELIVTNIIVTGGDSQAEGEIASASGGYVDGEFEAGIEETFEIEISMQPLGGKELLLMSEGERTKRYMKGYTATELQTAEQSSAQKADRVAYNGTIFEVQKIERWMETDLNHYEVLFAEVNE